MRMERTHHVADDLGALLEWRSRVQPQQMHAVENAAVNRLQPIARVGQRPVHDGRERVSEVPLFQRITQRNSLDIVIRRWIDRFSHQAGLPHGLSRDKRRPA